MKYSFKNDYSEGAHPDILAALVKHNDQQEEGYGLDSHSLQAVSRIRQLIEDQSGDVHFVSGGTQTNLIAISAFLRPHEACITAKSGHIATHEAGAIEASGHKLLSVETRDGKLSPELISPVLAEHHFEHMVKPAMVYISNPTELGTVYTKDELTNLSDYCAQKELILYIDGARLGCAIACKEANLTLKDVYQLSDAFFIGGTKNGALLGEALVIRNPALQKDMRYLIKQRGALLAKGRVIGIQFEEFFRDNLYFTLAGQANERAQYIKEKLLEYGYEFLIESSTNQIFPILENNVIEQIQKEFDFYVWAKVDEGRSAIRLVTSWATPAEKVEKFVSVLQELTEKS